MPNPLIPIKSPAFEVSYQAGSQLLLGRWLAPVLDVDLRANYAELLAAALRHDDCSYWLLNMQPRNWHMPSFGHWFSTEFVAAVSAALGRPVYLAYVLSPRHHTIMETARAQQEQAQCVSYGVHVQTFSNEAAALDWLRQQQYLVVPAQG